MSIVDSFRCRQDWTKDGYLFEVVEEVNLEGGKTHVINWYDSEGNLDLSVTKKLIEDLPDPTIKPLSYQEKVDKWYVDCREWSKELRAGLNSARLLAHQHCMGVDKLERFLANVRTEAQGTRPVYPDRPVKTAKYVCHYPIVWGPEPKRVNYNSIITTDAEAFKQAQETIHHRAFSKTR